MRTALQADLLARARAVDQTLAQHALGVEPLPTHYYPLQELAGLDATKEPVFDNDIAAVLAQIIEALDAIPDNPETTGARRNRLLLEAESLARRGRAAEAGIMLDLAETRLSREDEVTVTVDAR